MAERPPYRLALVAALVVLAIYLFTLAPTVTFWDAGEFIVAARLLGIPHPPGTPLFVLLTHLWGLLIPFGEYAWRINLFSAACSTVAAGCWFLVMHDLLMRMHADVDPRSRRTLARLGAFAATLLVSFTFTAWQNSNETEVYASATLLMAMVAWCTTKWRAARLTGGGSGLLLLVVYLGALAVGDHLMGLLIGPAAVAILIVVARTAPHGDREEQQTEWARIAVIAGAWVLFVGIGLGDGVIVVAGALAFGGASIMAVRARDSRFAATALVAAITGASTLLFLLIRAHQHPWLNSGDPSTWHALLDVIRRAQYPPRSPLDNPIVAHGPGNPGRSVTLLLYQMANYAQYFDWQWASSIGDLSRASWLRVIFTLGMATLGIRGAFAQRRDDPPSFALVATLFAVAGPGLVLYLNFKPGPSIGWDRWLQLADHEVRDRDYFFVASFIAWGIWVAIGLVDLVRSAAPRIAIRRRAAAAGVCAIAFVPLAFNWRAATRRQTAEVTLARDFGEGLLESVPPNGILLTWGDNDTFPLWFVQEVLGIRRDVTVVCIPLLQTNWYQREIRRLPHVDASAAQVPSLWRTAIFAPVTWPVHPLGDQEIATFRSFYAAHDEVLDLGRRGVMRFPTGALVTPADRVVFEIVRYNAGHRPIAWSPAAADALYGIGSHLVQQGMALVMPIDPVDSLSLARGDASGPGGVALDVRITRALIDSVWHFGRLEHDGDARLDGGIQAVAETIAAPYRQVGIALLARGDTAAGVAMLGRAVAMAGDSVAIARLRGFRPGLIR
ncbi:MAG TPA: DUF2723 domain-containing protein [Gemmatimonadales bacterium]|jgi:hypothetical protein